MTIFIIINVDEDVVQIHDDEDIELLCKNLINESLEAYRCVCSSKRHHLILELAVSSPERGLPLILFADFHLMVRTGKVKLSKPLSPS